MSSKNHSSAKAQNQSDKTSEHDNSKSSVSSMSNDRAHGPFDRSQESCAQQERIQRQEKQGEDQSNQIIMPPLQPLCQAPLALSLPFSLSATSAGAAAACSSSGDTQCCAEALAESLTQDVGAMCVRDRLQVDLKKDFGSSKSRGPQAAGPHLSTPPSSSSLSVDSAATPVSCPLSVAPLGLASGCLDEFLLTALKNRQDRLFLLKLDREFCNFIDHSSQEELEFPWLNSYYRMMIHRSANYFQLDRKVDPIHKRITLFKTDQSAIPPLRFCDLVEQEEEVDEDSTMTNLSPQEQSHELSPSPVTVKPVKVLKRCPPRPVSACETRTSGCDSSSTSSLDRDRDPSRRITNTRPVSMAEREKAYAKARARIFCENSKTKQLGDLEQGTFWQGERVGSTPSPSSLSSTQERCSGMSLLSESAVKLVPSPSRPQPSEPIQGVSSDKSDKPQLPGLVRRTSTSSSTSSSSGTAMTDLSSVCSDSALSSSSTSSSSGFNSLGSTFSGHQHNPHPHHLVGARTGYDTIGRQQHSHQNMHHPGGGGGGGVHPGPMTGATDQQARQHQQLLQHHHYHHQPYVSSGCGGCTHHPQALSQLQPTYPHPHHYHERRNYLCQQHVPSEGNVGSSGSDGSHLSSCQSHACAAGYHAQGHTGHQQPPLHSHLMYPKAHHTAPQQTRGLDMSNHAHPGYHHHHHHHSAGGYPHQQQSYFQQHGASFPRQERHCPHSHPRHRHQGCCGGEPYALQMTQERSRVTSLSPSSSLFSEQETLDCGTTDTFGSENSSRQLFQVSVRPYPSSNGGYRPCRQGITVPQQMPRPLSQRALQPQPQQQKHEGSLYHPEQPHRLYQRHSNQQVSQRQQQQQQQGQQRSRPPSSIGYLSDQNLSSGPLSSPLTLINEKTQPWRVRVYDDGRAGQNANGSGSGIAGAPAQIVYDVDRRPPKSTELYDPYAAAATAANGCGDGVNLTFSSTN